jgi:hypothetical protein
MAMFFFRITSKLLLLAFVVLMAWLAWDIWLLTPHAGLRFERCLLAGVGLASLPVLCALLARRAGTVAGVNVIVGTSVWFLAGVLFWVAHRGLSAASVCHAVQAGHAQMVPAVTGWIGQRL